MNDEVLVKAEGVSKKFCRSLKRSLWYGVQDVGSEILGRTGQHDVLRKNEFWAVDDVSFELRRGECLGLIGPNGAGKSTLLKVLNGLIKPDRGQVTMRGRVGALIELGAGFNPILTARENIYINGSVLGFSKKDIDRKFDVIVDFAEIGEFIDTPVQSFSSGMNVRLGFAIAAQMEPDVLLIDEVLAVGDVGFRSKCYNIISAMLNQTAIIFVSHSTTHIGRLCTKGVVLDRGKICCNGPISNALHAYANLFALKGESYTRTGSGEIRFQSIKLLNQFDQECDEYEAGGALSVELKLTSDIEIENIVIDIAFLTSTGELAAQCNNFVYPRSLPMAAGETRQLRLGIDPLCLNPGIYKVSALIQSSNMAAIFDWMHLFTGITIAGRPATAPMQVQASWTEL